MINISLIIERLRTRRALITIAIVLLALNLFRFAYDHFKERDEEISSKIELLQQYRNSTLNLSETKTRVALQSSRKDQLDGYLLSGKSVEEINSDVQIKLQELITMSGLSVESLRPVKKRDSEKDKEQDDPYGEISLKIRLSGNINQFVNFMGLLYKSNTLYKIETFTLKPYRNKGLKIFLDYKTFYKVIS